MTKAKVLLPPTIRFTDNYGLETDVSLSVYPAKSDLNASIVLSQDQDLITVYDEAWPLLRDALDKAFEELSDRALTQEGE